MAEPKEWVDFNDGGLPLQYTAPESRENAALLREVLGEKWLRRGIERKSDHPLSRFWGSNGIQAFLQLNSLADDLKVLAEVENLDVVILDLKNEREYTSARHVLRAAALFARPHGQEVVKFFPKSSESVPDFLVASSRCEIPVEAKVLTSSEPEATFGRLAQKLHDKIMSSIPNEGFNPLITVVVKNSELWPPEEEVLNVIETMFKHARGPYGQARSNSFNVFIEQPRVDGVSLGAYKGCFALSPRSDKESIRVLHRSKKASKQLGTFGDGKSPGLFCLGMDRHQEPHYLGRLLARRMNGGNYSRISTVLLMSSGEHYGYPKRAVVDFIAPIHNPKANPALPELQFMVSGLLAHLTKDTPEPKDISAYRLGSIKGKIGKKPEEGESTSVFIPDHKRLTAEMLA